MQSLRTIRISMRPHDHWCRFPNMPDCAGAMEGTRMPFSSRYFREDASLHKRKYKSKEERHMLIVSFVEKYKAAHDGRIPGKTLIHKEVGGGYNTVKEIYKELTILQRLDTGQNGDSLEISRIDEALNDSRKSIDGILNGGGENKASSFVDGATSVQEKSMPTGRVMVLKQDYGLHNAKSTTPANTTVLCANTRDKNVLEGLNDPATYDTNETRLFVAADKPVYLEGMPDKEDRLTMPCVIADELMSQVSSKSFSMENNSQVERNSQLSLSQSLQEHVTSSDDEEQDDSDFAAPEYTETGGLHHVPGSKENFKRPEQASAHIYFLRFVPLSATESDLMEAFKDCGEIVKVRLLKNHRSKTYGLVNFKTSEGLTAARMKNKVVINNITLKLNKRFTKGPDETNNIFSTSSLLARAYESQNFKENSDENSRVSEHLGSNILQCFQSIKAVGMSFETTEKLESRGISGLVATKSNFGVVLQGIPDRISPSEVETEISMCGEVTGLNGLPGVNCSSNYVIQFKTQAAQVNALAKRWINLRNQSYRVLMETYPRTTAIRICNIPSDVSESNIRSVCESHGQVVKIEARGPGIIDVFYDSNALPLMPTILQRLNMITVKENKLLAYPALRFSDQSLKSEPDGQEVLKLWQNNILNELEAFGNQLKMDLQDVCELLNLKSTAVVRDFTKVKESY